MMRSLLFFLFLSQAIAAQTTFSTRFDLRNGNDYGIAAIPLDSHYYVYSVGFCDFGTTDCKALIKVNPAGEVVWRSFVSDSFSTNYIKVMLLRNDTFMIHMGNDYNTDPEYAIMLYDTAGSYLGRRTYDAPGESKDHWARDICISGNQMYVSAQYWGGTPQRSRGFLAALDMQGQELWRREFYPETGSAYIGMASNAPAPDGGAVAIYSNLIAGWERAFVDRYTASGERLWRTNLGVLDRDRSYVTIEPTSDKGFICSWAIDTFIFPDNYYTQIFSKLDSNGAITWQRMDHLPRENFLRILVGNNDDFYAIGQHYYGPTDQRFHGRIRKMGLDGSTHWTKNFIDLRSGSIHNAEFRNGAWLSDGDLILVGGLLDSSTLDMDLHPQNTWLFRVGPDGCVSSDCAGEDQFIVSVEDPLAEPQPAFTIFPNPCTGFTNIGLQMGQSLQAGQYALRVFDLSGKLYHHNDNYRAELLYQMPTADWPPGSYRVILYRNGIPEHEMSLLKAGN